MYRGEKAHTFNCEHCDWGRHCDESNPAPFAQWSITGVIESDICLKPMVTEFSLTMLRLYGHYKNHWLPLSGGLLEQSNTYLQAMEIIDGR